MVKRSAIDPIDQFQLFSSCVRRYPLRGETSHHYI